MYCLPTVMRLLRCKPPHLRGLIGQAARPSVRRNNKVRDSLLTAAFLTDFVDYSCKFEIALLLAED